MLSEDSLINTGLQIPEILKVLFSDTPVPEINDV
jgi:hypothetical protein